ncbi:Heavy metal-associated domain, partial [Theobroma cacao]
MGEENREENKGKEKKEEAKDEKKEDEKKEEKKEEEPPEIVLKVDMHCEACARKVARALKGFEGVEEVSTDSKASKVVVKGKTADPIKVCERLQKKSGRKVELISPLPKPPEEKKEENKEPKEEKKEERLEHNPFWALEFELPILNKTSRPRPQAHITRRKETVKGLDPTVPQQACTAQSLQAAPMGSSPHGRVVGGLYEEQEYLYNIWCSVWWYSAHGQQGVRGALSCFCNSPSHRPPAAITVVMKVRMHCEACAQVLQKRIRKIQGVESVETDVGNDQVIVKGVVDPTKLVDDVYKKTKKQASIVKDEEKKEEEKKEEKKEEKEGEKKEGEEGKGEEDTKSDIKRSEYYPSKFYSEYAYHPQIFSDENPNACSVMWYLSDNKILPDQKSACAILDISYNDVLEYSSSDLEEVG